MIQTNFNTEKHFVLTNNEDKIMAIIYCPAGKNDISEKVKKAIFEDEDLKTIDLVNKFTMDSPGVVYTINALIVPDFGDDDEEAQSSNYNLTESWIY